MYHICCRSSDFNLTYIPSDAPMPGDLLVIKYLLTKVNIVAKTHTSLQNSANHKILMLAPAYEDSVSQVQVRAKSVCMARL